MSLTPNQVIGAVVMGEGFMAEEGERRKTSKTRGSFE
jgi:hypothetical protein